MPKWKPGESGNPRGKAPGTLGDAGKLRRAIGEKLPAIIDKLTQQALDGDTGAAKLLLDRCLPPLRPVDTAAQLPTAEGLTGIGAAAHAVLAGLTAGQTTPAEASTMANALAALARVDETTELAQRVAALEAQRNGDAPPNTKPSPQPGTLQ